MYKLLSLSFAIAFFAQDTFAAPRAQSAEECGIAADMAVVAQSLAQERIQQVLMKEILEAAYARNAAAGGGSIQKLAEELYVACMKTGGDMGAILGRRL